jgi:hypothetical protein
MSLLFSSVLIFILLSPGIVFRLSYLSSVFSRKLTNKNIIDDVTWSILPGILFQSAGFLIIFHLTDYEIRMDYIGLLLTTNSVEEVKRIFSNIQVNLIPILFYNISIITTAGLLGHLTRVGIRYFKLDRRTLLFRFSNKWHYVLSGECLDFPNVPDAFDQINIKIVDVLCEVGNKQVIYIGELFDYHLDNDGGLDSIHLRYPMRRDLNDDHNPEPDRYYKIPSRFIIIPYKTIININIRYFNLEPEEEFLQSSSE